MLRYLVVLAGAVSVIAGALGFLKWSEQRPEAFYLSDLRSEIITPHNAYRAQLLLIRPELYPLDFQSVSHLELKLTAALDHAKAQELLTPKTLVALPEHIGTWLLATGEKAEFYRARNRLEVRNWLLLGNPVLAIEVLLRNLDANRLDEALLRMKAQQMAHDYQDLFSRLAKKYQITLLAGSILLPEPGLKAGKLYAGDGPLENLSLIFNPDGSLQNAPYLEPWPWTQGATKAQNVMLGQTELTVERSWQPGYPSSQIRNLATGQVSSQLFLRGQLSWPIGGAGNDVKLTPAFAPQASQARGSHLLLEHITSP